MKIVIIYVVVHSCCKYLFCEGGNMSFSSIEYAIFLPIIFMFFWGMPVQKYKKTILLIANLVFYFLVGWKFFVWLIYVVIFTFLFTRNTKIKLPVEVLIVLLPLIVFKQISYFGVSFNMGQNDVEKIILPIGLSFYTFSALAYIIDVNKGNVNKYSFLDLATGLTFFPCLVAGPIERQEQLIPQIINNKRFDYIEATYGLKRIALGYFKKIVVADNIAVHIDQVYNNLSDIKGMALLLAALGYSIQIYADFSGYTDIAIGTAKLFGVNLTENFNLPYFSKSIK